MYHTVIPRGKFDPTGAVCFTHPNPDLWHSEDSRDMLEAKRVCRTCPIVLKCATYALANDERLGVWGGLDHYQRGYLERSRY